MALPDPLALLNQADCSADSQSRHMSGRNGERTGLGPARPFSPDPGVGGANCPEDYGGCTLSAYYRNTHSPHEWWIRASGDDA